MMQRKSNRKSLKGFSLVQMLVVLLITSTLMLAISDFVVGIQTDLRRMKTQQDRVLVNYVIDQALTSQAGLESSAGLLPDNELLKACIMGGATSTCAANCCDNDVEHEFFLLDPRDTNPDLSKRLHLGGTTDSPAYFDSEGTPGCTGPSCLFHIATKFKAHCPGAISKCDHAESVASTVQIIPEAGKESSLKYQERSVVYFVELNYKPFMTQIVDQSVAIGLDLSNPVYGNSGNPSEDQSFIYEKCDSADKNIATVTCYGFINAVGTIIIHGVASGTTKITLQINDGGMNNNLSDDMSFNVTVTP